MKSCLILTVSAFIFIIATAEGLLCHNCIIKGWDQSESCVNASVAEIQKNVTEWGLDLHDVPFTPDVAEVCHGIKLTNDKKDKYIIFSQSKSTKTTKKSDVCDWVDKKLFFNESIGGDKSFSNEGEACECTTDYCNGPKNFGQKLTQSSFLIIFSMMFNTIVLFSN